MKLLVTGATGFVGSQLVKQMASEGHQIRALVRKTSRLDQIKDLDVEFCYGDMNNAESLQRAVDNVDAVIHTAGLVREADKHEDFVRVNVDGTQNLLEACRNQHLKRFVYTSSLSVITGFRDHYGTKEDAPYLLTGENYADTKIEAEKLVLEYHQKYHLPIVVLRPGFIYGPGDHSFLPTVIQNLKDGKVILIDHGKKLLNLTYVGNLIEATELALTKEEAVGEIFNLTDGEEVSKQKFFNTIADLVGFPRPSKSIPFFLARILCMLFTGTYKLFRIKSTPPISRMKLRFAGQNQQFDITKAESLLGYRHKIHFDKGIHKAMAWYNQTLGFEQETSAS